MDAWKTTVTFAAVVVAVGLRGWALPESKVELRGCWWAFNWVASSMNFSQVLDRERLAALHAEVIS